MRLTALTTPTIQSTVNGRERCPSSTEPAKGQVMVSIRIPFSHEGDGHRGLDGELDDRTAAAKVIVDAQQRDGRSAEEQCEEEVGVGE